MGVSDGLQFKSSNLTVCTIAQSEALCEFCSPSTSLTSAHCFYFLRSTVKREFLSGEKATGEEAMGQQATGMNAFAFSRLETTESEFQ